MTSLPHKRLALLDRQRSGLAVELLEEAALVTRVAGTNGLFDLEKEDIAVAIHIPPDDTLEVAAGFALEPEFLAGAAPVVHEAGFEGFLQGLPIQPREHEHAAVGDVSARRFLQDGGDEPVRSKFEIEFHSCRLTLCRIIRNLA